MNSKRDSRWAVPLLLCQTLQVFVSASMIQASCKPSRVPKQSCLSRDIRKITWQIDFLQPNDLFPVHLNMSRKKSQYLEISNLFKIYYSKNISK